MQLNLLASSTKFCRNPARLLVKIHLIGLSSLRADDIFHTARLPVYHTQSNACLNKTALRLTRVFDLITNYNRAQSAIAEMKKYDCEWSSHFMKIRTNSFADQVKTWEIDRKLTNAISLFHDITLATLTHSQITHSIHGTFVTRGVWKTRWNTDGLNFDWFTDDRDRPTKWPYLNFPIQRYSCSHFLQSSLCTCKHLEYSTRLYGILDIYQLENREMKEKCI